jgi:regulator of sirC expression with transglutaminase-like and TPR domain
MNDNEARKKFAKAVNRPEQEIRLDEAVLLIAAESAPELDVAAYLSTLDKMASKFESSVNNATSLGVSVSRLSEFIHQTEGFSGNVTNYYAPENSYLNHVIDVRQGIPISLALIHICLGARLNIPVHGINFPGHFLVRYGTEKHVIVDPFSGRILSETDCATLLKQIAGPRAVVQPEYFEAATNRNILIRVLDNLKQIFWKNKAWGESRACIERQLLLLPDKSEFNIQLGAIYEMQGEIPMARHIYTQVLQECKDEQLAQVASKRLLSMASANRTVH